MAAAETARLIASLELQDKNFTRGIRNVERGVNRVDRKLGAFSGFVNRNLGRAIDSIALRFTQSIGSGIESLATLEDATTAVTGSITQVGVGWTTTGEDIAKWANEIEADTEAAFDDKAIVSATNTLIRYGKVSEKNLRPAMEVMTDLAAKTGDEGSAATLLARALADPAKAAGKLARAGVILTKAQQKQIKAMVKTGDVAGAQTLLLEILADTTEGAAKASAGPYRDAMNQLQDATEDAQRALAVGFLPIIKEVSGILTEELGKPETINMLKGLGTALAGTLRSLIGAAKQLPWAEIGTSLKIAGTGAKAVLDAFLGLPPWIQTAVLTGWGLNKLTGGKLFDFGKLVFDQFAGRGSTPVNPLFVSQVGPGIGTGTPIPGGGGGGLLGTAAKLVIPVAIASIAIGAARVLTDAIEPGFQEHLDRGDTPLANRDPRRFDKNGRVITNWLSKIEGNTRVSGVGDRPSPGNPGLTRAIIELKKGFATGQRPHGPPPPAPKETTAKQQATINAVKNAQSIASRENSAQKAELGNIKNASATLNTTTATGLTAVGTGISTAATAAAFHSAANVIATGSTTTAVNTNAAATRLVAPPIISQLSATGGAIVSAIWAARPVIQSTTVVNSYGTAQRGGTTTDSRNRGGLGPVG